MASEDDLFLEEYGGHGGGEPLGGLRLKNNSSLPYEAARAKRNHWKSLIWSLRNAFLPEGYPKSVTPDYLSFQFWDTLQGLSTYIRSMISTQVLLGGLGVGETSATVIGATFQWFVRDFTGMLGGILFTLFKGSNLDSKAKQWRLAADIINDVGMLVDLLSPLVPGAFLPLLCLGSISRAITGTASGATRAALTQHFAKSQNAADIAAKEGSQETMATMGGMLVGLIVARGVEGDTFSLWTVFLSLTLFHVYANYRAVLSLSLTSLNGERSLLLLQHFLNTGKALTPEEVSKKESVLPFPKLFQKKKNRKNIIFGARLTNLSTLQVGSEKLKRSIQRYGKGKYLLVLKNGTVFVFLHRNATSAEILEAYVHSLRLTEELVLTETVKHGTTKDFGEDGAEISAQRWQKEMYSSFISSLEESGWAVNRVLLSPGEWRADWSNEERGKDM